MAGKKGMKHLTKDFVEKNRDLVERLAAIGTTNDELGFVLGVSQMTVTNNFKEQLERGRANMRTALRKAQFESAVNDKNTTMLIWLGKNYLGQKEPRHDVHHSGDITFEKVIYDSSQAVEENDKNTILYA